MIIRNSPYSDSKRYFLTGDGQDVAVDGSHFTLHESFPLLVNSPGHLQA
jgi:hypothetical protein